MLNKKDDLALEKMAKLLSHQTLYIDQLRKENFVLQEDLNVFKQRLMEIIDENQTIHDDLQAKLVSDTLNDSHAVLEGTIRAQDEDVVRESNVGIPPPPNQSKNQNETIKPTDAWQQELQDLKSLYNAKTTGLETQIKTMKISLQNALDENESLKLRLKQQNEMHNVSLSGEPPKEKTTNININVPIIERLTRERDDLMKSVTSLRASVSQGQVRETEFRREVQKSLTALEDIQLEKTQFQVTNEQLKEDLRLTRQKLEDEINEGHKRVLDAAAAQRSHCIEEINDLQRKVGELMATCCHFEDSLTKCSKEKATLMLQLEDSRAQLLQTEKDMSRMKVEVEHEVKSALKGYNGAEMELRAAKSKAEEQLVKVQQERSRFEQESVDLHQRLDASELHVLKSQELNIQLTKQLNESQAKEEKTHQENIRLKKNFKKETEQTRKTLEERIETLANTLSATEIEYERRLTDLEGICAKQSALIDKLKSECRKLDEVLQQSTVKHRVEIGELTQKLEHAKVRVQRLWHKNKELSKQCVQHGKTHRDMRERLQTVNNRAQISTNQVIQLLDRQDHYVKEKELLSQEVKFLHSQVMEDQSGLTCEQNI